MDQLGNPVLLSLCETFVYLSLQHCLRPPSLSIEQFLVRIFKRDNLMDHVENTSHWLSCLLLTSTYISQCLSYIPSFITQKH